MLLAVLSGIIISILFVPFGKVLRRRWATFIALFPLVLFIYFASFIDDISSGQHITQSVSWIPSLGINLDFYLDGLSLLFCLLITGIGTLVFYYASSYLKGHPYLDRFYGFLILFMAAMLGMVLSDNIILFLVFWELTSISSFFLIGFNNDQKDSRKSALVALAITGGGGFFLMAGLVLMGYLTGTYSIQEMAGQHDFLTGHTHYMLVLGFVFIGAFTKSAQFPFHFWLPGAMKAPTPISAYLHSATMVKAGVFLLARMSPVLGGTDFWTYTLVAVGGFTMLFASFKALSKIDLKEVLAFSTISALGMLVFLIGIGTEQALLAAAVFILVHALYKASLFLVTGVIDHETGSRDLSKLRGLRQVMPALAIAGVLAALSSAGLPSTFGFIGKDLIYEATLGLQGQWWIILTVLAVITNIFLLAAGFLAGIKPFFGHLPEEFAQLHRPSAKMWLPPLILSILGLFFGLFPNMVGIALANPATSSMSGSVFLGELKIWHGFNTVLLLSAVTLILGTVLYSVITPSPKRSLDNSKLFWWLSTEKLFERLGNASLAFADKFTKYWHDGYLKSYLFKILLFSVLILSYKLFRIGLIPLDIANLSPVSLYEIAVSCVMIVAIFLTISTPSRLTAVVGTSVVGLCICLLFVFYSAPDLALTQFTIDTLTVVLFVLVLFRLPPFLNFANRAMKIRDTFLSIVFGAVIAITALHVLNEPINNDISHYYGENAYLLAKGKNVVNVILVDFRGFDTMFEIVVLSIAAIGVYSLLKLRLKATEKE